MISFFHHNKEAAPVSAPIEQELSSDDPSASEQALPLEEAPQPVAPEVVAPSAPEVLALEAVQNTVTLGTSSESSVNNEPGDIDLDTAPFSELMKTAGWGVVPPSQELEAPQPVTGLVEPQAQQENTSIQPESVPSNPSESSETTPIA